jgi:hypothetical protein
MWLVSQIILFVVNLLFGGVGTGAVSLALYSIVRFNELSSILPVNMLGMMLAAGIGIFALSVLGGCAAWRRKSRNSVCLLSTYATALFCIMCFEVVFGVIVGVYTGNLDVFKNNYYASTAAEELNNIVSCAYTLCCMPKAAGGCHPLTLACNTTTIFDITVPYSVCESLNRYDTSLLTTKCASKNTFITGISALLNSVLWPLSIAAVTLAVIQLACFIMSCCLVCKKYHHKVPATNVALSPSLAAV